jgi:CheY-like chemotaxis protein
MPRVRGPEATKQIRALGYKGIIVGVTGNALPEDVKEFIDLGADIVLPKPFDLEIFGQKVADLIHRTNAAQPVSGFDLEAEV